MGLDSYIYEVGNADVYMKPPSDNQFYLCYLYSRCHGIDWLLLAEFSRVPDDLISGENSDG